MFIFVTVLDKEHFWPKRKISLPQNMATSKLSKIPKLTRSQDDHESSIVNPVTILLMSNTSSSDNEQSSLQTIDNLTSVKKVNRAQEISDTINEKSIDSGFMDEKNKQKADIQSLPFTYTTVEVPNTEESSSHVEARCFVPLEEVDQGIIQTASHDSLASTVTSTSLEEMVGDECSSSGHDCVEMPKASELDNRSILTELHRPKSACDNYTIHHLANDQQMKRYDSLPQLESSPSLLASKINLLYSEKVFIHYKYL